jgi:tripartite-type tricarboxylate transporter receptor subunit TctC
MHRRLHLISLAASLGLLAFSAQAQTASYPTHPVKVVVALPAGGGVDMIARLVGQQLQAGTGQPFIVDNRAGASGRIGLPAVAKASPDGYTLMASPASFLTTNKSIFKDLPYDPQADFAPITKLANQAMVLVVRDRKKFPNAAAVLAAAKAQPTVVTYASSGEGSPQHLAALMFETRGQLQMTHVPYKGGALAINDMLGGNVDLLFAPLPEALPHLKSGKLTALALMSDKRSPLIAEVPTMAEAGIPDMVMQTWIGLLAPARTPRPIVDALNRQVQAILLRDDIKQQLQDVGMEVAPTTPEQFQHTIAQEISLHAQLVKAAGLVPQ